MVVVLDGNRFVPSLVDGAATHGPMMVMPPPYLGGREPLHESRQLAVVGGPHDKMKVIRHQDITEQAQWDASLCLRQYPKEGTIVALACEYW